MTKIEAKVLLDSEFNGNRLTTMQLTYPRFVHAEYMTHRVFCLSGDTELTFDLPSGDRFKSHKMTLGDFVQKWHEGVAEHPASKYIELEMRELSHLKEYTTSEAADLLGFANASGLNKACREGALVARKAGKAWLVTKSNIQLWRNGMGTRTFSITDRLSRMRLRQMNEETGEITHTTIEDCVRSGVQSVYRLDLGDRQIKASLRHRFLTDTGWVRLEDLRPGDKVYTSKRGKPPKLHLDPIRHKKIGDRWVPTWNRSVVGELVHAQGGVCFDCHGGEEFEVHHVEPVHSRPDLAFSFSNVLALCSDCHQQRHTTQGWQTGVPLYIGTSTVQSVEYVREEETFDIEVASKHPNFLANGIVTHNSRNAASSRAIPVTKMISNILGHPVIPIHWGANQSGMQAFKELDSESALRCEELWLKGLEQTVAIVQGLLAEGLHKQIANRLLEPWMHITVIHSSTNWENYFNLRCHEMAEPHMAALAYAMRDSYRQSVPVQRSWHMPLVGFEGDEKLSDLHKQLVSVARCARVSYLTHVGTRDVSRDLELAETLRSNGHFSPWEHVAHGTHPTQDKGGNFKGWRQLRWYVERGIEWDSQ